MNFGFLEFAIFLVVTYVVFLVFRHKYRQHFLFIVSLVVLWFLSVDLFIYGLLSLGINFLVGRYIDYNKQQKIRYLIYLFGQVFNIGGLILFKYLNLIIDSTNSLLGLFLPFSPIHSVSLVPIIGVSYFTFQAISYLYLVYKAGDEPASDFVKFGLFMFFFPKVLAGPIERHRQFFPQLDSNKEVEVGDIIYGSRLFIWGAFKKIVIADSIGHIIVTGLRHIDSFQGSQLVVMLLLFPLYLYTDFSGYTDMARGLARIFGYKLALNFKFPFFAQSISEFWRYWHISLSSWCNDFLFTRLLVKHRKWGKMAFIYAVFITFIVIGIWHGSRFNFIVLGFLQGLVISVEFLTKKSRKQLFAKWNDKILQVIGSLWVYLFFSFTLIFFFVPTFDEALLFIQRMFLGWDTITVAGFEINEGEILIALLGCGVVSFYDYMTHFFKKDVEWFLPQSAWLRWFVYGLVIMLVVFMSKNQSVFIYAEF